MKRTTIAAIALCLTAATGTAGPLGVGAHVPASCTLSVGPTNMVSAEPLFLRVAITRDCNTTHDLRVSYKPLQLTHPNALLMFFDGEAPDEKEPGTATFTNLPHTQSVKLLRIYYAGPEVERKKIKNTFTIDVMVH